MNGTCLGTRDVTGARGVEAFMSECFNFFDREYTSWLQSRGASPKVKQHTWGLYFIQQSYCNGGGGGSKTGGVIFPELWPQQ